MIEGAPGHGEGHNSGVPLNIIAALAVKKVMEREHLQGTIQLWPGVAEEVVGTKAYFVRAGLFKNVDVVLFCHVASNLIGLLGAVAQPERTGVGGISCFKGESAHAAGAPWRGRSALDAVELMDVGWNFRREHLRLAQRSHYVITNGGDQPNVVPPTAAVWYYFREADYDHIMDMWRIGDNMAKGAHADDRHHLHLAPAGQRLARPLQQADRRRHVREHQEGGAAAVVGGRSEAGPRPADRAEGAGERPGHEDSGNAGAAPAHARRGRGRARRGQHAHRRRLRRYRRRFLERAHRDAALSLQHSRRAGPQLGERHRHGHAHRAQRRDRGRQGAGHDHARHPAASRAGGQAPGTTSTTCRPRT